MIRILKPSDIDAVMNIWLSSNIQAHSFIPREYWMKYFGQVKEMLPDATVYVYEDNGSVQGFIGLTKNYIEGIFVEESMRGKGIGTQLLNLAKQLCSSLTLQVYEKINPHCGSTSKRDFKSKRNKWILKQVRWTLLWNGVCSFFSSPNRSISIS